MNALKSLLIAGMFALSCFVATVPAQESLALRLPNDTKFALHIDLQAFRNTESGEKLLGMIKEKIIKELAEQGSGDDGPSLEGINDVLGFDPFVEIQEIVVTAADYEHPERSLLAVVQMKQTTGNLEGLMLALPGFATETYQDHKILSATPDQNTQVFAAIYDHAAEGKRVVISSNRAAIKSLLDQFDGNRRSESPDGEVAFGRTEGGLVNLQVLALPTEKMGEGPHVNVARILKNLSLTVTDSDGTLNVTMSLAAKSAEQQEQLRQLTEGVVAMVKLAPSLDPDDEDLKKFHRLTRDMTATQEGGAVRVTIDLSSAEVVRMITEAMDDE